MSPGEVVHLSHPPLGKLCHICWLLHDLADPGSLPQGEFLRRLGIEARAEALKAGRPAASGVIARQLDRLTGDDQMGTLFKAAAIFAPRSLVVPGWDA